MGDKKATRRSCSYGRAKNQSVHQDSHILAQTGFDRGCRISGWVIGIAFGLMFLIGLIAG